MNFFIKSTITAKIGFASHQNSVPVVRDLEVVNKGLTALENLVLDFLPISRFWKRKAERANSATAPSNDRLTKGDDFKNRAKAKVPHIIF